MTAMICWAVTPCAGVRMTNTSVVLGIAALGTSEAPADCDCAADAMGSAAISNGIMNFIGFSSRYVGGSIRQHFYFFGTNRYHNTNGTMWYHTCQGEWALWHPYQSAVQRPMTLRYAAAFSKRPLQRSSRAGTQRPALLRLRHERAFQNESFTPWLAINRKC